MPGRVLRGVEFKPKFDKLTLGEFYFELSEEHGDKIFQIDADLDTSETYESVKRRSTRLAINLRNKGVDSKDVIGLCSGNSLDTIIPLISALYLGAKVVNLDPSLSARSTKHLLTLVTSTIIFVDEQSIPLIEKCLGDLELKSEIIVLGKSAKYVTFSELTRPSPDEDVFRPVKVDLHDTALIFFTSGTTGLPKALLYSHYGFLQVTEIAYQSGFTAEVLLYFGTFYWTSGLFMVNRLFIDGSTRVFARTMQGESTFKTIEKYKVTSIFIDVIRTYLLTAVPNPERFDVSSFTCLLTTGTPMSTDQHTKLMALFPNAQVVFGYGMTEVGIIAIFHTQNDRILMEEKVGSCGKAAPGTLIKVVDLDTEELLGPNQKGEVRVKSGGLFTGYRGTDSTSCFDSHGFIKSGDIGYYDDDGCLHVVERMKEMFKYMTWHIVPASIEAVLREHPSVKDAVVFGVHTDEDEEMPAACVVLEENCAVCKDDIEKFVAERVSDWERLRGGVVFVESLPKTPTGKLMRREAKDIAMKTMQKEL